MSARERPRAPPPARALLLLAGALPAGVLLAGTLLSGCGEGAGPCGPQRARVARVLDGDTLRLEGGGPTVRLLLVDAPEAAGAGGAPECFAPEATGFLRAVAEGREVGLSYGEACTDRFGRLLAYVHLAPGATALTGPGGSGPGASRAVGSGAVGSLNAGLVERGLGCALYVPPSGGEGRAHVEALEDAARAARRGLWGACSPRPCG
jgi:micrococcal nuclease